MPPTLSRSYHKLETRTTRAAAGIEGREAGARPREVGLSGKRGESFDIVDDNLKTVLEIDLPRPGS